MGYRNFRAAMVATGLALMGLVVGCSAADVGTGCETSAECSVGFACTPAGQCGVVGCEEGCLDGETCLQVDDDGNYDPRAEGVCTAVACSSGGRGGVPCPDGQECIDGACYNEGGNPGTCTCSDDCTAGQGCVRGTCSVPPAVCTTSCECPSGQTCIDGACGVQELCGGVVCPSGSSCVADVCTTDPVTCNPACGEGETCNDAGVCEPTSVESSLCAPCSGDADCGGEGDSCITLTAGQFCGQACTTVGDCPSGYSCFRVDSISGSQCVPAGGTCGGCLVEGCAAGQYCDANTLACAAEVAECEACTSDAQCGTNGKCEVVGGTRVCLDRCDAGATCGTGYTCSTVAGSQLCAPDGGACGGACSLTPASCTGATPVLNSTTCACVGCVEASDCGAGLLCSPEGECIFEGDACTRISDCPTGQICDTRVGTCVQCITAGDCASGQICNRGRCEECDCPPGQRCSLLGTCEDTGVTPGSCGSGGDSACQDEFIALGGDPAAAGNALCDSTIGCYLGGQCNGSVFGGGGGPADFLGPILAVIGGGGGFGGTEDPFNAPCAPGSTCTGTTDILALLGGGSGGFGFSCSCDPSGPETCREGESCQGSLLPPPLGSEPTCKPGAGGSPFPFPIPF